MSFAAFRRALCLPLRSGPLRLFLFTLLLIAGAVMAIAAASVWIAAGLGVLFGVALLPGSTRYLLHVAEQSAAGRPPQPPDTDMFTPLGSAWPFLAMLLPVAGAVGAHWLDRELGRAMALAGVVGFVIAYPAVAGVLVITHSPVQACRPRALLRFIGATGSGYWYAAATLLAAAGVPFYLAGTSAGLAFVAIAAFIYLLFAFFAVLGAAMRGPRLIDEVAIPDAIAPARPGESARLERRRTGVLNHAYGFASRGNRQGALDHIDGWLREDPDPDAARAWFLEQLLRWERPDAGLYFAQSSVTELLARGEQVAAVKVMLRARLADAGFRPRPDDLPAAIEAARASGNGALADALGRSRGL